MNKLKKNYGMTLVSLIVTLIIMLILAGIVISLVVGNNGVLTQASSAVEKTREGTAREEVALAWESIESEYISKHTQDSSISKAEYFTEDNLNKYLVDKGIVTDFTYSETSNTTFVYTRYEDNTSYQFIIDTSNVVTIAGIVGTGTSVGSSTNTGVLSSVVTASNYGDTVTYSAGGVDDWKILYNDATNVFIIASDYVENSLVNTSSIGADALGTYSIHWANENFQHGGMADVNSSIASKYMLGWYIGNETGTNTSAKVTAALLDTSAWSSFVDTNYANSAIGSPTLEMWVASWNAKGYTKITYENGANGYQLLDSGNSAYSIDLSTDTSGYADLLYFPHTTAVNNNVPNATGIEGAEFGYWIASPDATGTTSLFAVSYSGYLYDNLTSMQIYCARPVVCLSSEVNGSYSEGNWTISN